MSSWVYCKCFCTPKPGVPKAFTGLYYARVGTTGIWYWQRRLDHAYVFKTDNELSSDEALAMLRTIGNNIAPNELVGFVAL